MEFGPDTPATADRLTIRCRLFGRYAELTGFSDITLELPALSTVADALEHLRTCSPGARRLPPRPLAAVNLVQARPDTVLSDGAELALLPPVAGG